MSHHRRPSAGACEVVPNDDELACALRGFGEGPRLCSVHRKEYGRLTATYKGLSEKAEKLYAELLANDWTDETLWNVDNVTTALTTASSCIHAIDEEIVSRQEHHRRFFVELHDGHEAWIQRLRKRLSEVEAIAEQLQTCKAMLVEDERRRNEARRQAEARRQRDASRATRMYSHWSGPHTTSRVGTTAYRHEGYSNTVLEPVSIKAPLRRCIANLHDRQPSRCSFEALQDLWWCQAHSEEQRKASSALRVARTKLHGMEDSISLIRRRVSGRFYSDRARVLDDIGTASLYKETLEEAERHQAAFDRLNGHATSQFCSNTSLREAENLISALRSIMSEPMAQKNTQEDPPNEGQRNDGQPAAEPDGAWGFVLAAAGAAAWLGIKWLRSFS